MTTQPTAIIIGAGMGSIAAAARLARRGYSVTVLAKNAKPGGQLTFPLRPVCPDSTAQPARMAGSGASVLPRLVGIHDFEAHIRYEYCERMME